MIGTKLVQNIAKAFMVSENFEEKKKKEFISYITV